MRLGWYNLGLAVAFLAAGPIARAQSAPPVQIVPAKEALEWAKRGRERFENGDHAGAIAALTEAERLHHSPTFVHFLALAHEKMGHLVEAKRLHETVVTTGSPPNAPSEWATARRESAKAVRSLVGRIPTIEIVLSGAAPSGLVVTLNNDQVHPGALGQSIPRDPGTYTLVVGTPGRDKVTRSIVLKEGARERVSVTLPPDTGRGGAGASLRRPGASGKGDGLSGGAPDTLKKAAFVSYGIGTGGLVVGSVAGILAVARTSDAQEECGPDFAKRLCRIDRGGSLGEARTAATVSTAGFALAAVGAVAGTVLLVWPRPAPPLRVAVTAGGLAIEGGF